MAFVGDFQGRSKWCRQRLSHPLYVDDEFPRKDRTLVSTAEGACEDCGKRWEPVDDVDAVKRAARGHARATGHVTSVQMGFSGK